MFSLIRKPLLQIIVGGFLIFSLFIFIWWIIGAEIKESRVVGFSDIVDVNEINNSIVASKIVIDTVYRDDYLVIRLREKTNDLFANKSKRFFYSPFMGNYEKRVIKNSYDKHNGVFIKNVNIIELLAIYSNLTNKHFLSFLKSDNLKNSLTKDHEKSVLSVLDGVAVVDINFGDNDKSYFGKIKLKDTSNIEKRVKDFEGVVTSILGAILPIEKKTLLPDETYINEIVSSKKNFNFNDVEKNGKKLRYIKEDRLNFSLAYSVDDDTVFFSDKIDLSGKSFFYSKNNNDEFLAVMPINFLSQFGINIEKLGLDIQKYKKVIIKESKKFNEIWIILK